MSSAIRILHISPHDENDGIARYQEQYLKAMADMPNAESAFFSVSPTALRSMSSAEKRATHDQLRRELRDYDVLHIQHEFGLFAPGEFRDIVSLGKQAGKKVVVSMHLSPAFAIKPVKLGGLGPRSLVMYLRQRRYAKKMVRWNIEPMKAADAVLVHDTNTEAALLRYGVFAANLHVLAHPVYDFPEPPKSTLLADKLQIQKGDIVYCTVGMMHRYKGVYDAVKALKFLLENYKLAIIGGIHPLSEDLPMYNKLCDLIDTLGLQRRVYITGFVTDDNQFNALIRECDVCVYPYDGIYYAHASSGALNLAFSNGMPAIAYPTTLFKEIAETSDNAIVLTDTFAYYELARELQRIDMKKQSERSVAYAKEMAWPKVTQKLVGIYEELTAK